MKEGTDAESVNAAIPFIKSHEEVVSMDYLQDA